jgi:NDP-sugar pyrophosphorylase family protein
MGVAEKSPIRRVPTYRELLTSKGLHGVILSGGFGKRNDAISDALRNKFAKVKPSCEIGASGALVESSIIAMVNAQIMDITVLTCVLPESLKRVYGKGDKYNPNLEIKELHETIDDPLDTAGAVANCVYHPDHKWHENPNDIVIVASADIMHDMDLKKIIEAHLYNWEHYGAVATIVSNRLEWHEMASKGSILLEGAPLRKDHESTIDFEKAFDEWRAAREKENACLKIIEFSEKKPRGLSDNDMKGLSKADIDARLCVSNENNGSLYVFNASLFSELYPILTKKDKEEPLIPELFKQGTGPKICSDWGKHVIPEMLKRGHIMYSYLLTSETYWKDAATADELRLANLDVVAMMQKCSKIPDKKEREKATQEVLVRLAKFGIVGLTPFADSEGGISLKGENVYIDGSAYTNGVILGSNVIVSPNARIVNSVIGHDTQIMQGAQLKGSLVFGRPKGQGPANIIGEKCELHDSVMTGGQLESGIPPLRMALVYPPVGGLALGSMKGVTKFDQEK